MANGGEAFLISTSQFSMAKQDYRGGFDESIRMKQTIFGGTNQGGGFGYTDILNGLGWPRKSTDLAITIF